MTDYPDLEPDGLGDLKSIARLPSMSAHAPKIKWGDEYQKWPVRKRLRYAERLAATMNHAADLLQTERNELVVVCKRQEAQIKQLHESFARQGDIVQGEFNNQNVERQALFQDIVRLKKLTKDQTRRIRELETEDANHG